MSKDNNRDITLEKRFLVANSFLLPLSYLLIHLNLVFNSKLVLHIVSI